VPVFDRFHLVEDWHAIVRKAWSFRLAIASGFLTATAAIMAVMLSCGTGPGFMAAFMVVSVLASITSFSGAISRVIDQPKTLPKTAL